MKFIFARNILVASIEGTRFKDIMGLVQTAGVMGFIMYSLLGNDEQWEELMRQEALLYEGNTTNGTNVTNATLQAVVDTVSAAAETCVGAACSAASAAATGGGSDEF